MAKADRALIDVDRCGSRQSSMTERARGNVDSVLFVQDRAEFFSQFVERPRCLDAVLT
jgi:hypothetical protein